ncbi:MAG: STAS domain-containing protein [Mycobacterium sp.]|nr:STAS domain-containing protein [Mycobacterium sp.]MBV9723109.1 STAS domain-containing protein [Mycobacterium sp.]
MTSGAIFHLHNADTDRASTAASLVAVTGEVDVTNVDEFTRSVLAVSDNRPIILQLSGLRYLDSAGFAAVDRLLADGAIVVVLSPDSLVHRAAELMCLPFHHDTATARELLQHG